MKEKLEIDKLRGMTEEERQAELEKNPKIVTNQADKGKYRYMQKYFHRGAFYLDEEQDVFKRDFAEPTLEDHFDKTILPKVMQVKNFGRSGRTKYTHLVDQDTTVFDSPWVAETSQSKKFVTTQAGGSKPIFERPSKRRKT
ncbi:Microfibrillar-associated protein 1 [Halotydeus destructor]|nr:Microfibrillar-associated protein 1 [Halotydeus destructor]